MSERVPSFEIFCGRVDQPTGVLWVESVGGLASANRRMHEIAAKDPGPYFVFSVWNPKIVAHVDTTPQAENESGVA